MNNNKLCVVYFSILNMYTNINIHIQYTSRTSKPKFTKHNNTLNAGWWQTQNDDGLQQYLPFNLTMMLKIISMYIIGHKRHKAW